MSTVGKKTLKTWFLGTTQAADLEEQGAGMEKSFDSTFQERVNLCWKESIIIPRGGELATSVLSLP